MDKNAVTSRLKQAKRHIATQDRYRFYPLYSVLIGALLYISCFWPLDMGIVEVWRAHPWLIYLSLGSWDVAVWLGISLGLVGFFRYGWTAKIVSAAGIWASFRLYILFSNPLGWIYTEVTWYLFDVPHAWIVELAGGNRSAETTLWACVLVLVWLATRPLFKMAYRRIQMLGEYVVSRWPTMARMSRPVI